MRPRARWVVTAVAVTLGATACDPGSATPVPGGDPARGAQVIAATGCGACHHIPGIAGANGMVGPPLDGVALRGMIAGEIPNSPENMMLWVMDPQAVERNTAMPNAHLDPRRARDVVAYLYTLH